MNIHSVTEIEPSAQRVVDKRMQDKRERILRAALALFAERGFHGAAVPLVAERARVGAGTIYRFFESKEALVNAVFLDAKTRLGAAMLEGVPLGAPPREMFDAFWEGLLAFARDEPTTFHFLELQDHAPYLDASSRALESSVLAPIHGAVAAMQAAGALRADLAAPNVMAMIWGAFVGLIKAERLGYARLDDTQWIAARDACWRAFACVAHVT